MLVEAEVVGDFDIWWKEERMTLWVVCMIATCPGRSH